MDCRTQSRIRHLIWRMDLVGEKRGTTPYHSEWNMRVEKNGSGKTERQSRNTPSQTVDNSKCHTQSSTHMARVRASPFQKNRERMISHAQRPAVDKMSHLLDSKQPKAAVLSVTVWLLLSCRSIDRFQECGVAVHNWVLVKWRNTNHTSLLARPFVLKVQHYENATQNTQSRRRKEN